RINLPVHEMTFAFTNYMNKDMFVIGNMFTNYMKNTFTTHMKYFMENTFTYHMENLLANSMWNTSTSINYSKGSFLNYMRSIFTNNIMQMNVSNTLADARVDKDIRIDKSIEIDCAESNVDSYKVIQDTVNLNNYTNNESSCEFSVFEEHSKTTMPQTKRYGVKGNYLPASALYTHQNELYLSALSNESLVETFANHVINPDYTYVVYLFEQYRNSQLGEQNGVSMF
ncbi:26334_t:CDS:2, partial [Dentiscutata erythropus]